ncbi:hypothetical protein ACTOB_004247 [Actinoplanes oblitus]|uniref:Uncharacterized protein n=1 Tax=Actinoplanes oblitus TaxID=3040509 RepID=A0ABY8WTP6_9ACTN|nr:hypothetical protein [Actinoplanes oblitus]WIN00534.1 hypothetical protein ACTOB_004247 [Actinoplanes oblitus]
MRRELGILPGGGGPQFGDGIMFRFGTFGFPLWDAHLVEVRAPGEAVPAGCPGRPGRTANPPSNSTCCTPGCQARVRILTS